MESKNKVRELECQNEINSKTKVSKKNNMNIIIKVDKEIVSNSELTILPTDSEYKNGENLSHTEAMVLLQQRLSDALHNDPLLSDLPAEVTPEEVDFQIALEYGQAIKVNLRRGDNVVLPIVVVENGTVRHLKEAMKRSLSLKMERENGPVHLNWVHLWKTHWLVFDGRKLIDNEKLLKEYGVTNHCEVCFVKRLNQK